MYNDADNVVVERVEEVAKERGVKRCSGRAWPGCSPSLGSPRRSSAPASRTTSTTRSASLSIKTRTGRDQAARRTLYAAPHPWSQLLSEHRLRNETHSRTLAEFLGRVEDRTLRVGIIGLGYVGLPLTLLFSEERFRITGFDIDPIKVATLNRGESYIHRIEPAHIPRRAWLHRLYRDDRFLAHRRPGCRAHLRSRLPLHEDHTPDLSYVASTMEALAPHVLLLANSVDS